MNPKHIAIIVFLIALLGAFKWYGSSMYEAGETAERSAWQDKKLIEQKEHIRIVAEKVGQQRIIQANQVKAERAAAAKTVATLQRKLKLKTKVKNYVKENTARECLDVDGLRLANEILTGS